MYFSDYFKVNRNKIKEYGAIDINLACDLPLFIDPMLIFNSEKLEYKKLHEQIIRYFHFLAQKSESGFSEEEIHTYFNFSEIKNNWLGYSKTGNTGNGNGWTFSVFFAQHIRFALNAQNISKGLHFEKALLLFNGNGRDKISDLTTHLILDYLANYTQKFAIKNIDKKYLKSFFLESIFNYKTESFVSIEYTLPYITNEKGASEFILLTPKDILRKEEPAINRRDLERRYDDVRNIIDNPTIRYQLDNYIAKAVSEYEKKCQNKKQKPNVSTIAKIEKHSFIEALHFIPELYDYYVKLKESEKDLVASEAINETDEQLEKFYTASRSLIQLLKASENINFCGLSAQDEAKQRIMWYKHIIEDCDGYKNLYYKGQPISTEDDLQRLFRFVWFGTTYDVNYETNNGRGESDVKVSFGAKYKSIIEFKLASNPKLNHIFDQVKIYEKANLCCDSVYVIFFFSKAEHTKIINMINDMQLDSKIGDSIFLIDCRKDNKTSASLV